MKELEMPINLISHFMFSWIIMRKHKKCDILVWNYWWIWKWLASFFCKFHVFKVIPIMCSLYFKMLTKRFKIKESPASSGIVPKDLLLSHWFIFTNSQQQYFCMQPPFSSKSVINFQTHWLAVGLLVVNRDFTVSECFTMTLKLNYS